MSGVSCICVLGGAMYLCVGGVMYLWLGGVMYLCVRGCHVFVC